jgi:hypothetical protein
MNTGKQNIQRCSFSETPTYFCIHTYLRLSTKTGGQSGGVGSTIRGSKIPDGRTTFLNHFLIWYLYISELCLPQTFISMVQAPSYAVIRFTLPVSSSVLIYFLSNRAIRRSIQNILSSWLLFASNNNMWHTKDNNFACSFV